MNIMFATVKSLILRKFVNFGSDPDSNLFGSCSDPELDPNPNIHEIQDSNPNKVGSDLHTTMNPGFKSGYDQKLAKTSFFN